tara:strand:- start:167 stop:1141 length:975 start_codon:yes stop_codon:yes gene_type:complete
MRNKFFDISDFKSIGLIEIIFSLKKYIKMISFLKNKIIKNNYDLVICIDSPEFNYNLISSLRKKNYSNKIIQIVAPTVWAWRPYRALKFAKLYNEIFILFDFEKQYFNFPNFNCTFIGHPIYHIKKRPEKSNYKYISFLFGSRENEINKLFEYFDYIEKYIRINNLKWKIFIPTLPHLIDIVKNKTSEWSTETLISDKIENFDEYYNDVFISITCSGTASLEIAKRNIPQIIIYKLNYTTEIILKLLVKVRKASILNIISNKIIIPEVVNSKLTKKSLISSFTKLLNSKNYRDQQIKDVNFYLPNIESNKSPYDISVNRILEII